MKKIVFSIALTAVCSVAVFAQTQDAKAAAHAAKVARYEAHVKASAAENAPPVPAAPKNTHPSQAEIQQKADAAAAQFIARYNLDAKQAEQVRNHQFAMIEKIAYQIDEKGNVDTASVERIKTSCIESMAIVMTAEQRKKFLADFQAGMYK
jgi:hypothetical protein